MAPKYKLIYFNVTGIGEPIRFLFSYGNIEFEDVRFEVEEWPAIKPTIPFGALPVLEVDGKKINQSVAITRYVAKLVGLAGKDDIHALEIDAMLDNVNDIRIPIRQYHFETDEEIKEKKRVKLVNETLPDLLGRLDSLVNGEYFVRGELSWADVTFAAWTDMNNAFMEFDILEKYPNLQKVVDNVRAIPSIKAWIAKRPKTKF